LPAECGTLLGWNAGAVDLSYRDTPDACAYVQRFGNTVRVAIFAKHPGFWSFDGIESDAELLGIEICADAVVHLFAVRGTTIRILPQILRVPETGTSVAEWCVADIGSIPVHPDVLASLLLAVNSPTVERAGRGISLSSDQHGNVT
jgi:hypothetical protein